MKAVIGWGKVNEWMLNPEKMEVPLTGANSTLGGRISPVVVMLVFPLKKQVHSLAEPLGSNTAPGNPGSRRPRVFFLISFGLYANYIPSHIEVTCQDNQAPAMSKCDYVGQSLKLQIAKMLSSSGLSEHATIVLKQLHYSLFSGPNPK